MPLIKRWFWNVMAFLVVLVVAVLALYINDLNIRYPDMDYSRLHVGISSWYSETDPGINERTANNEKFDDEGETCATWHYPFHEKLLVINGFNLKQVVCRVNDRGPAKRLRREIDLTKAAFLKISSLKRGLIPVVVVPIKKAKA